MLTFFYSKDSVKDSMEAIKKQIELSKIVKDLKSSCLSVEKQAETVDIAMKEGEANIAAAVNDVVLSNQGILDDLLSSLQEATDGIEKLTAETNQILDEVIQIQNNQTNVEIKRLNVDLNVTESVTSANITGLIVEEEFIDKRDEYVQHLFAKDVKSRGLLISTAALLLSGTDKLPGMASIGDSLRPPLLPIKDPQCDNLPCSFTLSWSEPHNISSLRLISAGDVQGRMHTIEVTEIPIGADINKINDQFINKRFSAVKPNVIANFKSNDDANLDTTIDQYFDPPLKNVLFMTIKTESIANFIPSNSSSRNTDAGMKWKRIQVWSPYSWENSNSTYEEDLLYWNSTVVEYDNHYDKLINMLQISKVFLNVFQLSFFLYSFFLFR
jgi:hypothetical protein